MSIGAHDHQARERGGVTTAVLFGFGLLAAQTGDALASPADDGAAASVLGTYECNSGSTAFVVAKQPVKVDEYTASNPLLRVTITSTASTSKANVLWWDRDKRTWNDDPSAVLEIKQFEADEKSWAVTFEGSFGSRIGTAVWGYLSWFAELGQPAKPTLVLTQTSPSPFAFASASALLCDKL
jgi:hypothetical protein